MLIKYLQSFTDGSGSNQFFYKACSKYFDFTEMTSFTILTIHFYVIKMFVDENCTIWMVI